MATLVLTTVGTLVGGPIGGAIGALIGGTLDQKLLGASAKGPRLSDLSVQTSSYGNAIPKIFGTLRVAGTVIWATDLREHKDSSGGGKGKPKTTTYSYSASFAVALSGRPLRAVHRIWADGNLLRGSGGDWKSDVGAFRFQIGDETQPIDPLIASAEGIAATPAHRGIAYVVFEDLQLADYGNRIPSLTFEVEADAGDVAIGEIARALAPDAFAAGDATSLGGYAVAENSVRDALATIGEVVSLSLMDDGERLRLVRPSAEPILLDEAELGAAPERKSGSRRAIGRQATGTLPDEVMLSYFDPSRDYQSGTQRARRGGVARRRSELVLPAALAAAAAKGLAEARLASAWAERVTATALLPWRRLALKPGDIVTLPEEPQRWKVASASLEAMAVKLELAGVSGAVTPATSASAGRSTREADAPAGATIVHILDLPALEEPLPVVPRIWIAACGSLAGWRRAALSVSLDGGTRWTDLGTTAASAVIGTTLDTLPEGDASFLDADSSVTVELAHDAMALAGRDDIRFDAAANLALIGDELVQFGSVEQIASRRWRLDELLRGRRGTEWATRGHAAGERFVLLETAALLAFDPPVSAIGATLSILASGVGDAAPMIVSAALVGRALRPPAPVRIGVQRLPDGALQLGWRRRSRSGWPWLDGVDAPLGEDRERYRLTLTPSVGSARTVECEAPSFLYSMALQAADGSAGAGAIEISLSQIGALAASLPEATAHLDL